MSEILTPKPDDIAPLLLLGLEDAADSAAMTLDATIRVDAPTPRTGGPSQPRGWEPPSVAQLQQMLPQYDVTSFIARGGMGAVYKGQQKTLKRPVAIKVLPPDIEDGDMQFAERFKHEAQSMARLSHPNIVAVFDAGEMAGGLLYFVMEYIEGTDVAQLIASEGALDPQRAVQIITAVCEALAFAHEEGIVHRDIKPSNVMIDKRGRVKVADFGLAKSVNLEATLLTGTNLAMGTPDFIAPEAMIPGMKIDQRADLYAVDVMLYQMLTGKIPRGRFQLPSGVVPQMDKGFDPIVDKAMQTDREQRYSTATEMKRDVEKVVQSFSSEGPANTKREELRKHRGLKSMTTLLGIAAVAVIGAGAFFALKKPAVQDDVRSLSSLPTKAEPVVNTVGRKFPAGQWVKVLTTAEELRAAAPTQDFQWRDDWIDGSRGTIAPYVVIPGISGRDVGIRLRGKITAKVNSPLLCTLSVRVTTLPNNSRQEYKMVCAYKEQAAYTAIQFYDGAVKHGGELAHVTHETLGQPGDEFVMEMFAIGDRLISRFNGKLMPPLTDNTFRQGGVSFQIKHLVRDVEVINLDGLSEAEALKLAGVEATTRTAPNATGSADRNAALRVLKAGGSVLINTASGSPVKVSSPAALPAEAFDLMEMETTEKNTFNDEDMAALAGLPMLQKVKLLKTAITGQGLQVLAKLPALSSLDLDGNVQLRDDDLKVLEQCPKLQVIRLQRHEKLTSAVLRFISPVPELVGLSFLDLPLRAEDTPQLLKHRKLQFLNLTGTTLDVATLEALHQLPELLELRFSMPETYRAIDFTRFPKLKSVGLTNGISAGLVKNLAVLGRLESLVITVPGKSNPKGLDAETIQEISNSLKSLTSLALTLDVPLQGSAPLSPLAALPKLQKITVLQFSGVNAFDDAALLSLEKVAALRTLTFAAVQHRVTQAGIAEFQKRRPDVKIDGPGAAGAPL